MKKQKVIDALRQLADALEEEAITAALPKAPVEALYLSQTDAARLVGKSQSTIWRWIQEGKLTQYKAGISRNELLALASEKPDSLGLRLADTIKD